MKTQMLLLVGLLSYSVAANACTDFSGSYRRQDGSEYKLQQFGCEVVIYRDLKIAPKWRKNAPLKTIVIDIGKMTTANTYTEFDQFIDDTWATAISKKGNYLSLPALYYFVARLDNKRNLLSEIWTCPRRMKAEAVDLSKVTDLSKFPKQHACKHQTPTKIDTRID